MSDFTLQSASFEEDLLNMDFLGDSFYPTFQFPELPDHSFESTDIGHETSSSNASTISLRPIKREGGLTNRTVKKSSSEHNKKAGSKLKKVVIDSKTSVPNIHLPELNNVVMVVAPNMSRRSKDFTLYAFPNFNKCDALLYFPSTMARHLNSGDHMSLTDLFNAHFHKNCQVQIVSDKMTHLSSDKLLGLFQIMNEVHPDSMLLMHTTKVVDSEIRSTLYFKGTDTDVIFQSLKRSITEPTFAGLFAKTRAEHLIQNFHLQKKPETERHSIISLIESGVDVVVYGKIEMKLSFDENTKRVMNVRMDSEFTSIVQTTI